MSIVSNTSPVLNLGAIGEIEILRGVFGEIVIPVAVADEVQRLRTSRSRFSQVALPDFVKVKAVETVGVAKALRLKLHSGEAEAIALAMELNAEYVLLDEHPARSIARKLGVPAMGCVGILLDAKRLGLIASVRPILELLETTAGFWIGKDLRERALAAAGE